MSETKRKPKFYSINNSVWSHNMTKTPEVNGFEERARHLEMIQKMLDKATNLAILDVKKNPIKRCKI